ncbi:MAG: hypothetical protein Q8K30_02815 [Candidatus Gracilibacteria bacterium]|nr:hypothetical protein [Candidatus Gracilibacteria bacterium]
MKIYIKTPFFNSSKYMPHLVEHIANNSINLDKFDYLNFIHNSVLTTFSTYTLLDLPDYYDIDKYLEKIFSELDEKLIKSEKKVLKEELKKTNYNYILFEKIGKKIYGKFFNNNGISKVTTQEVKDYHKKYYNKSNIIICDEDFNIINSSYVFNNERQNIKLEKNRFKLKINGYNNYVIADYYNNWQEYYLFFFLEELFNSYFEYNYRFLKREYYYSQEAYFFRTDELNFFVISGVFDIDFDREFFDKFKEIFIKIVFFTYGGKGKILNKLFLGVDISDTQILDYINSIDYNNIKEFLGERKDYN